MSWLALAIRSEANNHIRQLHGLFTRDIRFLGCEEALGRDSRDFPLLSRRNGLALQRCSAVLVASRNGSAVVVSKKKLAYCNLKQSSF